MKFNPDFEQKILEKDIPSIARAITLNESTRTEDNLVIDKFIAQHRDKLDQSLVISISGIPGVGKSTFIETLGVYLHGLGKSLAVFSIDPSSEKTHGSILGDKTRMSELSRLPNVFIRPSPSSNRLGGLGINTHKNIEIAKIAGYDIILVETVGVGQSETIVRNLCDIFLLLLMPASGDELQGIKKGIMEVADFYVIHKADGDLKTVANKSKKEVEIALHLTKNEAKLDDKIFAFSSMDKIGLETIWSSIEAFAQSQKSEGIFFENRKTQRGYWLEEEFDSQILKFYKQKYKANLTEFKDRIAKGETIHLEEIISLFR